MAPIMFTSSQSAFTRAEFTGAEAAEKLGNKFVVAGFKGDATASPGSIVFDNYLVEYTANTANTTESNSANWEYVGKGLIPHAAANGITQQTIKYWDYTKNQYDFFAWSTGNKTAIYSGDPAAGQVLVSEIRPNSKEGKTTWATGDPNRAAYTFTGTAEDLSQCYISDLVTVNKSVTAGYGEVTGYDQTVKLTFRQLGTKVRIAIYETVPGYSVKDVKFYSAAASNDASAAAAKIFTTEANEIYTEGTYTVYFPTVDIPGDADNNQAHIKFAPKEVGGSTVAQSTTVEWGGLNYTIRESGERFADARYLGRTSNTASYAGTKAEKNYYEFFLPNETGTNLNLRVNYTLESIDGSGEEIVVKGATAQVPSIYTQWKPGFAYTYLFKISDKTNGHTGVYDPTQPDNTTVNSDPAGLYPITFDAVAVNAEDGNNTQETITLISTPSITTYQNGSNVVNNNEYTVLTTSPDRPEITGEIYVTVNDGEIGWEELTPGATENVKGLYTKSGDDYILVTADDQMGDGSTKYYRMKPIVENGALATLTGKAALYTVAEGTTEAEVVDAMQYQEDDLGGATIMGRNKVALNQATGANALSLTNEVTYGADGNKITVSTDQAAKFKPAAETTYAFVYTKQAATPANDVPKYQQIAYNDATVTTKYRFKLNDITDAGDVQKGVVYFAPVSSVLTKKSVFIGQGAGNLYTTSNGVDYTAATTEYAVTGTTYFYKLGSTYKQAHNVAYADFEGAELYVKSGAYYVAKTETKPVDGTAYYYKDGDDYIYCVIQPERTTTDWKTLDDTQYVTVGSEAEIVGMTYFDKYIKNNGVYYVKVIKVE